MKKKLLFLLMCVVIVALLTGCACKHEWVEATCLDPRTCSLCEETEGEALGHTWVDADCVTPKTCSVCAETEGEPLGHTWVDADCVTPKTCSVCAATEGEPLGHTWVDADCVTPKTCSVCAATEGEALGHTWVEADCVTPKTCSVCAETEGEPLGHTWVEADCVTPKTCSVCAATEGEALGHTWVEADCVTPKTCSVCAVTEGEALGHTWVDADCVTPKTCSVCAETEGEPLGHTWVDADCVTPKTCSVCAETEGEPLGHTWVEATCDAPKTCSVCAVTEGEALGHTWVEATCDAPKTCSVCAVTEGEALGHTWVEATCDAPKTCSVCAETDGEALEHQYTVAPAANGMQETCDLCGHTVVTPFESASGIPLANGFSTTKLMYAIPDGWLQWANEAEVYLVNPETSDLICCHTQQHNNDALTLEEVLAVYQSSGDYSQVLLETRADGVEYISMLNNGVPFVTMLDDQYLYYLILNAEADTESVISASELASMPCWSDGSAMPDAGWIRLSEQGGIVPPEEWSMLQYSVTLNNETHDKSMFITMQSGYEPDFTIHQLYESSQSSDITYSVQELRTNSNGVEYLYLVSEYEGQNRVITLIVIHDCTQYYLAFGGNDYLTDDDILYTLAQDIADSFRIID